MLGDPGVALRHRDGEAGSLVGTDTCTGHPTAKYDITRSNGRLIHVVVQELTKLPQHKSVAFTGRDSVGSDQLGANEPGTGQIA